MSEHFDLTARDVELNPAEINELTNALAHAASNGTLVNSDVARELFVRLMALSETPNPREGGARETK